MEDNKRKELEVINGSYEPKRKNRFLVKFPKELEIQQYSIVNITKPSLLINHINRWGNIEITFIDFISPSTSQSINRLVDYIFSNMESNKPLLAFEIISLDPVGIEVENWKINVAELIEVNYGMLDYDDDKRQEIKIIVRPESCTLTF